MILHGPHTTYKSTYVLSGVIHILLGFGRVLPTTLLHPGVYHPPLLLSPITSTIVDHFTLLIEEDMI